MKSKKVLEGDLSFLNLGDLLQLLSTDSRTGVLYIFNSHFNEPGAIYIKNGNPYDANASTLKGIDALYALFGWVSGQFQFVQGEVDRSDIIKKRMMAIVLDALRVLDEGDIRKFVDKDDYESNVNIQKESGSCIKGPFIEYSFVVDEEEYPDGAHIVTQGKHGNWLWVVLDGLVDIMKQTEHGKSMVMTAGTGAFIGSLSNIIQPDNTRSASAVARGQVQLGVIDTQKIYNELSYLNDDFKRIITSFDNRLRKITSRYTDVNSGLCKFEGMPGSIKPLIKTGDKVQNVFRIVAGEAFVVKSTNNGNIFLMKLEKDDFIGNIPFLSIEHEPLSMAVYASDDLKLEILDIDKINQEFDKLSITIKNIIEYTSMCISLTTKNTCS